MNYTATKVAFQPDLVKHELTSCLCVFLDSQYNRPILGLITQIPGRDKSGVAPIGVGSFCENAFPLFLGRITKLGLGT